MPIQLNNPKERPFSEIDFVGLAIKYADPYIHIGFLYRNEDNNQIRLSDLAFHCVFRGSEDPDESYFWLEPQVHAIVGELIAAFLLHVAEENQAGDVPYSILNSGTIDKSGKILSSGLGAGLTCASYILKVFEVLAIPLIVLESWPVSRGEDVEWAKSILKMLEGKASPEHIDAQRDRLPNVVRYRPEEVGAAFATFTNAPLSFEQVKDPSEKVLAQLRGNT